MVLILGLFPGTPLSPEEIHFSMVRGWNGSLQNWMTGIVIRQTDEFHPQRSSTRQSGTYKTVDVGVSS